MKRKELLISGPSGLTPNNAKLLVQTACRFNSQISIEVGNKRVNAKSMMGILAISNIKQPVAIEVDGDDEDEAVAELTRLAANEMQK